MATILRNGSGSGSTVKVTLAAGETSAAIPVNPMGCAVYVNPGSGGTMLAECTFSPGHELANAVWFPWSTGTASAKAVEILSFATAVRFTATTVGGVGGVSQ